MGDLKKGAWRANEDFPHDRTGHYVRSDAPFRNWVTATREPGPTGAGGFKAEPGRYHLIVSLACPWAHRTLIFRKLKGLEGKVSLSVVNWLFAERGWTFDPAPGVVPDPIYGAKRLREFYLKARPDFSGRVTVPVLWDRQTSTIVNNGVYRAGFATSQEAYEEAFRALFETLDMLEARLAGQRFLCGERLTEADWRLFTTLIRFDRVYFGHFKCNLREIRDYPALSRYLKELYRWPGVAETVDFFHIKHHYYASHLRINPTGIVPLGPEMEL